MPARLSYRCIRLGFRRDSCELSLTFSSQFNPAQFQINCQEMVYVLPGDFYLGDGASKYSFIGQDTMPILIKERQPVTFGSSPGNATILGEATIRFELNTDWPLGTRGFYLMKYEISQQQYLDFYNSLTAGQRDAIWSKRGTSNAFALDEDGHRNGLMRTQEGFLKFKDEQNSGKDIACNYLNWDDLLAWLDWAGLRPITELEFEKGLSWAKGSVAERVCLGHTECQQHYDIERCWFSWRSSCQCNSQYRNRECCIWGSIWPAIFKCACAPGLCRQ